MTIEEAKRKVKLLSKTFREGKDENYFIEYIYDYEVEDYFSGDIYTFCIETIDLSNDFNDNDWEFIRYYLKNKHKDD